MENAWETKQWEYIVTMYEHRYKYGKQKAIMTFESFREKIEIFPLKLEQKAYLVLLWHSGDLKSEVYESKVKEVTYPYRTLLVA